MGKKKKTKKDPLAGDVEIKLEFPVKTEENPLESEDEICEDSDAIKLEVMHIAAAQYSDEEDDEKPKKRKREIDPSKLTYHCTQCSSSFTSKVGLKSHVWTEHTREYGEYSCDVCEKRFKTRKILGRHKKFHTSDSHKCNICLKKFSTKTIVERHIATVHAEDRRKRGEKKAHVCPHCGKAFISKCGFEKHLTIHSDDRPFECPECPLRFKNKSALDKHGAVHTKPYSCPVCDMKFSRRSGLSLHSSKHLNITLKCPYCDKCFPSNEKQRLHCERHHPGLPHEPREGPVLCTICNEIYENLEVLMTHVKIHPIVRKYECEVCEAKFFTKNAMLKHIKQVHLKMNRSVKTTFPCSVCKKTYLSLRFLKRHKCNTEERPYKCTICSKAFKQKKTLDDHQAVHSEKRTRYSCTDCEKKFNWRSGMRKHMLKHHGKTLQTGTTKPHVKGDRKSSAKKIKEEVLN